MSARHSYTVRYRRRGWNPYNGRKARYFRDREAAARYIQKLRSGDRPDLSPIVELVLERQELGPAETIWSMQFEEVSR